MFANSNRSKKRLIAFFRRKKTTSIFFRKLITIILLRETITYFFLKTKTHFAQKRVKKISNEKIENEINVFSKRKRRRYKKFTHFEKNKNHFTISSHLAILNQLVISNHLAISNYFTISRKNLFRTCRHTSINYHDSKSLIDYDFTIIKKFVEINEIYRDLSQIQFSRIFNQIILLLYLKIYEYHEKNESSYQYIFSFTSFEFSKNFLSIFFLFVFISNN